MAMLHDDMTIARIMLYAQSIEESIIMRITRKLKRSGSSDQDQFRFKKRDQTQEEPRNAGKFEKGGGSQNEKLTCVTCVKRYYGKCLAVTSCFFVCYKDGHKVRDCPTITARGIEAKQVSPIAG